MVIAEHPVRHVDVPDRLRSLKRRTPRPAKRAARDLVRRFGQSTASARVLPSFLVIGTKRGGTTSLFNWLLGHPQVLPLFPAVQQIKSPHYFDLHYDRPESWYRSHFPTRRTVEHLTTRFGHPPAVGEASPYYVFHPEVPARVASTVPDVRLVLLLRDPVKRAYSNYWERRGSGCEDLPTFEEAIAAEEERLREATPARLADPGYYSQHHDCHSYLARGRYAEHLAGWTARFPREQLLVLRSEDLYRDPRGTCAQVQRHLGLDVVDVARLDHHNKLPVPPMREDTRERLLEYFHPHNLALYEALGRDLGWDAPR